MRYLGALVLCLLTAMTPVEAQEWEERQLFGTPDAAQTLRVISSTDISFFAGLIDGFLSDNPNMAVDYMVTGTADIPALFQADPDQYDVVISSAMDLQLKLANDGHARRIADLDHPAWAQWRQSLFGFTSESASIVLNNAAFDGEPVPQTRQALIQAMRARPDVFAGKVGTYDIRQSGVGYLFATQDARASDTFWRLMEVMGSLNARLYCCSGEMIDDVAQGRLVVAYNVLGSYAQARTDSHATTQIVLPSDFPTTMMRTALVSSQTRVPDAAEAFLRHVVRAQTSNSAGVLPPLNPPQDRANQAMIPLEPALMTYLDALKRRTFLQEWESAIIQRR